MTATILQSEAGINTDVQTLVDAVFTDGGFTYNLRWNEPVPCGYAVAVYTDAEVVTPLDDFDAFDVEDYILTHAERLHQPDACLGAWVHNGLVYLDISIVLANQNHAIQLGRLHRQIAVYDLNRGCDILINYEEAA